MPFLETEWPWSRFVTQNKSIDHRRPLTFQLASKQIKNWIGFEHQAPIKSEHAPLTPCKHFVNIVKAPLPAKANESNGFNWTRNARFSYDRPSSTKKLLVLREFWLRAFTKSSECLGSVGVIRKRGSQQTAAEMKD